VYELLGDQEVGTQWRIYLLRAYDWEPAVKPDDADHLPASPPLNGFPPGVDQKTQEVVQVHGNSQRGGAIEAIE
jgi:hypothetical protein